MIPSAQPLSAAPQPAAPPKPKSLGTKIFVGCLVVLFAIGLGLVVLLIAGGMWIFSPGRQVSPARLVAPDAEAVARFDNLGADAGFRALATRFVSEAQIAGERDRRRNSREERPWLEGLRQMQNAQGAAGVGEALGLYLPREAVLSFERSTNGEELEPLFVANFHRFVRPVRLFLEKMVTGSPHSTSETYRGRKLLDLDNGPAMAFEGGTLLVASKVDTLKRAIDRLDLPPGAHPLLEAVEAPEAADGAGWDVTALADSPVATGAVMAVLGLVGDEGVDPFAELGKLGLGVDVVSGDEILAELRADFPSEEAATQARPLVEARWTSLAEQLMSRQLALSVETSQQGTRLTTRLNFTGLGQFFRQWLANDEQDVEAE